MNKINYGFDAPAIMRNLILFGIIVPIIGFLLPYFYDTLIVKYVSYLIIFTGFVLLILGTSMYVYGIHGKFRMRDFILSKIAWKGDENVLDI
jgi:arsenite methyltransferase